MKVREQDEKEMKEITDGITALFLGKNKRLALIACLSISATTARMLNVPKDQVLEMLGTCYDHRAEETN